MAHQAPWNKYEVALLIECYINVSQYDHDLDKELIRLSADLRVMAIRAGNQIDDVYRNLNGMRWQYQFIKMAFEKPDGVYASKKVSSLFASVVKIYKSDKQKFYEILKEAYRLSGKIGTKLMTPEEVQQTFADWLVQKGTKKYSTKECVECISRVSEYAVSRHISKVDVWLITDYHDFNKIRVNLSKDKIFRFTYPGLFRTFEKIGKLFSDFIRETHEVKEELVIEKFEPTVNAKNEEAVDSIEENDAITIEEHENSETLLVINEQSNNLGSSNIDFATWLVNVKKLAVNTSRMYMSSLSYANEYALREALIEDSLLNTDVSLLKDAVERILNDEKFASFNIEKHNRFSAALQAFLAYRLGGGVEYSIKPRKRSATVEEDGRLSAFAIWLEQERGLTPNTARSYISSLGTINTFALDNGLIETDIPDIADADLQQAVQGIFEDSAFAEYNSAQHNRFSAALQTYLQFKLGAAVEVTFRRRRRSSAVAQPAFECPNELRELLVRKFPYGIRIDSSIDLMKLKNFAEMFEVEIPADEDLLKSYIVAGGINFEGKTYFISDGICEEIVAKIRAIFDEGFKLIYYEEFFNRFFEWFDEKHISSAELVRELLASLMDDCFFSKNFVYADANRINELEAVENELANVWGEPTLHTYDDLYEMLPFIPDEKIRFYLSNSKFFVWNSNETFVWTQKVVISDEDKQAIIDYANNACNCIGYVAISDLPLDKIIEENYELSLTAIYKAVYVIVLENDFALNGKILNKNNSFIDELSLAKAYCAEREECSFTELYSYIESLVGSGSRRKTFIAAYDTMIRVGDDKFVAEKYVNFDVDAIDSLLKEAIVGDFIAVKGIATFALFPNCNYTWNHYILESFCYRYSKLYRLEVKNFNDKNAGIIVKKKSNLRYTDMLALVAAKSRIDLTVDTVGKYLFDNGYVAKRKMSIMEEVVEKAKSLREVG